MKILAFFFSIALIQVTFAAPPTGEQKSVYICGKKVNEALLFGEEWSTAIVYYTGDKKDLFLATGWPAFPKRAKVTYNSEKEFVVEGPDEDTYRVVTISKDKKLTKIGSYTYPVVNAHQDLHTPGIVLKNDYKCIYFPENDHFGI